MVAMSSPEHIAFNNSNVLPTTDIAPAWVPSPPYRGTFDILSSCIITLLACIYTAIHLNVPPLNKSGYHHFWWQARWVAVALFAPDIVLYTAIVQFYEAYMFVRDMKHRLVNAEQLNRSKRLEGLGPAYRAVNTAHREVVSIKWLGVKETTVCDLT